MVPHKPLKCLVATQAETAVIELDKPSCELLLQYRNCGVGGGGCDSERLIKETLIGTAHKQLTTVFYRPVKRHTIHQPENNFRQKMTKSRTGGVQEALRQGPGPASRAHM